MVNMRDCVKDIIDGHPTQIKWNAVPWNDKLFKVDKDIPLISPDEAELFHSFIMKGMFLVKRVRPDEEPGIRFFSSRVKAPAQQDKMKLIKTLGHLKQTLNDILTLEADDTGNLHWHIDTEFAVHYDMKSHTGSTFTLGKGSISSSSTKQKINSRSSTEGELIGIDDKISKVIWTKKFIEEQGFKTKLCIMHQYNASTIKLVKNGRRSVRKRSRHFDMQLFYAKDYVDRKEVSIQYCPTEEMLADYMSKPLVGAGFKRNRQRIMNATSLQ